MGCVYMLEGIFMDVHFHMDIPLTHYHLSQGLSFLYSSAVLLLSYTGDHINIRESVSEYPIPFL